MATSSNNDLNANGRCAVIQPKHECACNVIKCTEGSVQCIVCIVQCIACSVMCTPVLRGHTRRRRSVAHSITNTNTNSTILINIIMSLTDITIITITKRVYQTIFSVAICAFKLNLIFKERPAQLRADFVTHVCLF